MNKVILMGRLTADPEMKQGTTALCKYTIAVDRRFKRDGEPTADFFNCTAFGKAAEFTQKYFHKGSRILVTGRIENNNYTNKDGQKVYSVGIIVEEQEFCESKKAEGSAPCTEDGDGFMNIPSGIEDELPFA